MLYLDSNQNYHIIKSCAIANLADLQLCFEKLAQIQVEGCSGEESISNQPGQEKCSLDSPAVISLLQHIARLSGVSFELLASDIDGVLKAIAEVNFQVGSQKRDVRSEEIEQIDKTEGITLQDYQYQLVTSLVNAELAVDLEAAVYIASELPYKDVEGYLRARIKFLNQDQIEKEKKEKFEQEKIEEVKKEVLDGSFFEGLGNAFKTQLN